MDNRIFIAGAGGIGEAAALLLREWSVGDMAVILGDIDDNRLAAASEFVTRNSNKSSPVETVKMPIDEITEEMRSAFERSSVLLDCSPGSQAPRIARFARDFGMHYANLTEYVAETDEIIDLARGADTGFILQTGLAPGYINVLAMSLYRKFEAKFNNDKVEKIGMKVGALTAHAHQPHFYGFTWSPIGVATEYVKNSRVLREYAITERPALSAREKIVIAGRTYEADLTSGGAADLPDFFEGKARTLDYKTLRYVGHYDWVESIVRKLPKDRELPGQLQDRMLKEIPSVENDLVLVHASVEGFDPSGRRRMLEKGFFVEPIEIDGKSLRAIQITTAAPLCESAMMLMSGRYKGVVLQSQLDPEAFLAGRFVSRVYR